MMAPTIRVDDEVFAWLQEKATAFVDTPNTVLRRELGLGDDAGSTANEAPVGHGALWSLLESGALAPNDALVWERRGVTHEARVTADGNIYVADNLKTYSTPSGAARDLAGYEVNGWRSWKQKSSGKTLDQLR